MRDKGSRFRCVTHCINSVSPAPHGELKKCLKPCPPSIAFESLSTVHNATLPAANEHIFSDCGHTLQSVRKSSKFENHQTMRPMSSVCEPALSVMRQHSLGKCCAENLYSHSCISACSEIQAEYYAKAGTCYWLEGMHAFVYDTENDSSKTFSKHSASIQSHMTELFPDFTTDR